MLAKQRRPVCSVYSELTLSNQSPVFTVEFQTSDRDWVAYKYPKIRTSRSQVLHKKKSSEKFNRIHRKTPMMDPGFSNVLGWGLQL